MRRNRNKNVKLLTLILLLLIGIGFAALAANLKINGTVNIDSASWDVHFENVQVTQGSVTANPAPVSDDTTTTEMTYGIDFTKPGDFYEFTVDIANDGSLDAMIDLVSNTSYESDGTTPKNLPDYLKSTVTYNDETPVNKNQLFSHGTSEKIKVRVEYRTDIDPSDLPDTADTIVFKFSGNFKQADSSACQKVTTFANDSWDTIACNVKSNPASYPIGTEKNINMDVDGDSIDETYTLRVANNTTPAECSTQGFSQTACGFVLEFKRIIKQHVMNSGGTDTVGNRGGWETSEMRNYINTDVYNLLPDDLKSKIINTSVISGYGPNDSSNFVTTDKLYLLDAKEVYGDSFISQDDTAKDYERQLDYYNSIGVTISNYSETKKIYNETYGEYYRDWWLRSAGLGHANVFHFINYNGNYGNESCNYGYGVSPAFRIG